MFSVLPVNGSFNRFCIGINQQFLGDASRSVLRSVRAVDSEAISLACADVWQIPMPAESRDLREFDSGLVSIIVKETQFDSLRDLGEDREIGPGTVKLCAEWVALTYEGLHSRHHNTLMDQQSGSLNRMAYTQQVQMLSWFSQRVTVSRSISTSR